MLFIPSSVFYGKWNSIIWKNDKSPTEKQPSVSAHIFFFRIVYIINYAVIDFINGKFWMAYIYLDQRKS